MIYQPEVQLASDWLTKVYPFFDLPEFNRTEARLVELYHDLF